MFEWDEAKCEAAIEKHGVAFRDAIEVFSSDHLLIEARSEIEPSEWSTDGWQR